MKQKPIPLTEQQRKFLTKLVKIYELDMKIWGKYIEGHTGRLNTILRTGQYHMDYASGYGGDLNTYQADRVVLNSLSRQYKKSKGILDNIYNTKCRF